MFVSHDLSIKRFDLCFLEDSRLILLRKNKKARKNFLAKFINTCCQVNIYFLLVASNRQSEQCKYKLYQ